MNKFSKKHYKAVAEVIKEWQDLNPEMPLEYVQSLINGFDLLFRADSNEYDRYKFSDALTK